MRFSTVTILAFIAYTSNQVIAAPVPHSTQVLAIHDPSHKQHVHYHGRHGLTKDAHAQVHAEDGDELAEQNGDPDDAEFSHPYHPGRHDHHQRHQKLGSEPLDRIQNIQARNRHVWDGHIQPYVEIRDLQAIEARSCSKEIPCDYGFNNKLRGLHARSLGGDSTEHNEEPHDADAGPLHQGHHGPPRHNHEYNLASNFAHELEENQVHSPHGTDRPHHRGRHNRQRRHRHQHHQQQHLESPVAPETEEHQPNNSASGQSPGPAPSKRGPHNEDKDEAPVHRQRHHKSLRRVHEKYAHGHGHALASAHPEHLNEEDAEAHEDKESSSEHEGRYHQKRELEALFARDLQELEARGSWGKMFRKAAGYAGQAAQMYAASQQQGY